MCASVVVRLLSALVLAMIYVAAAGAETIPSASSPRVIRIDEGLRSVHAWFVVPAADGQTAALMHVPPRDGLGMTGPGTARKAADMPFVPEAIAASGETLYIIRPIEVTLIDEQKRDKQRRVLSLRARPISSGFWDYEPPFGRVEPKLPGDGELIDAVGGVDGPAVLLGPVAGETGGASEWRLMKLRLGAWDSITLTRSGQPVHLAPHGLDRVTGGGAFSHARLVAVGSRHQDAGELRLLVQRFGVRNRAEVWRVVHEVKRIDEGSAQSESAENAAGDWRFELVGSLALPGGQALESLSLRWIDDRVIALAERDGATVVWALDGERVTELNRIQNLAPQHAAVGLTGLSRLALISVEGASPATGEGSGGSGVMPGASGPARASAPRREMKFVEVSTLNGSELFSGSAKRDGPLTRRDVGTLALIVSAMTAVVLLFVLRADNTNVVRLPKGYSLAAPARRFVAAMIDFLPGYVIAVWSMGVSLVQIFLAGFGRSETESLSVLGGMDGLTAAAMLMAASLVAAAAHCAVGEWLLGRSLGKLLTGCEVVSIADQAARAESKGRDGTASGKRERDDAEAQTADTGEQAPPREGPAPSSEVMRISLWQAVVRNAVRWIPPLAILVVLDTNFRHPGDVLARTVVVIPPEPDEDDDERDDDVR